VNDTQLETAIVGEDILLTPRSPDAQPDAQSDALLAAGDQPTSLTLQTCVVLQRLFQSRMPSAVSSLGMLGCRQYVQSRSIKQCSICTTACSVDIRHLLYTSASHLHNIVQQVRPSAATLCTQCITADAFDLAKATRGHASHHSLLPGSQELALVPCPRTYWFRMLPVLHTSLLSATSFDSQYSCKLMVSTSTSCVPVFRACNFIVADLC